MYVSKYQKQGILAYATMTILVNIYSIFICTQEAALCRLYGALPAFPWYLFYYNSLEAFTTSHVYHGAALTASYILNGVVLFYLIRQFEHTFRKE